MAARKEENRQIPIFTAKDPEPSTESQFDEHTSARQPHGKIVELERENASISVPINRNLDAARFMADLTNNPIDLMSKNERFTWMRELLTKFKLIHTSFAQPAHIIVVDGGQRWYPSHCK